MASRFDEIDLLPEPALAVPADPPTHRERVVEPHRGDATAGSAAPRWRRAAAFLLDTSLFAALILVLSPLLPAALRPVEAEHWLVLSGVAGFLLLVSYYYFTGSWLIWGKTVGGAIFDVRVISNDDRPLDARSVTARWLVTLASIATAGVGFLPALLPGGRSAADRLSATHSIRG